MRSTLTTLAVGFILGATLGFAGLWTQVIQPAKAQIEQLEAEHGVMQSAIDSASEVLAKAAQELRAEAAQQAGVTAAGILPGPTPQPVKPTQPGPTQPASGWRAPVRNEEVAKELETTATQLKQWRTTRR